MNCQDFESIVVELARRRPLEAQVRENGLAHAGSCRSCGALLQDQRALSGGLSALAESSAAAQAPARLEASLTSAFRAQAALPESTPVARGYSKAWALVAAACLVMGVAIAIRMLPGPQPPVAKPRPDVPAGRSDPRAVFAAVGPDAAPAPVRKSVRRPIHLASHRLRPAEVEELQPSGFVPLLYGYAPMPLESGHVVRLKLPRSTLAALGLPTNASRGDAVQADVLFTEDGMARAIRFVP